MNKFFKTTLFGGLVVILPVAILGFFFRWLFKIVTDLIQPLTNMASKIYPLPEFVADMIVILIILATCFILGLIIRTQIGNFIHQYYDNTLQKLAPGYRMAKEVVVQIFGNNGQSPFSNGTVARVRLFGVDCATEVTALVTDIHADGTYTVFMPTGPNPSSGNIYHVSESQVTLCPEIPLSSAMRTIIACGAGSAELFGSQPTGLKVGNAIDKPQ